MKKLLKVVVAILAYLMTLVAFVEKGLIEIKAEDMSVIMTILLVSAVFIGLVFLMFRLIQKHLPNISPETDTKNIAVGLMPLYLIIFAWFIAEISGNEKVALDLYVFISAIVFTCADDIAELGTRTMHKAKNRTR